MTNSVHGAIALEKATEELRQERETFDQRKLHDERWFSLRLRMGYVAIIFIPGIAILSGYILLNPTGYSQETLGLAGAALFADVLGLLIAVWKVVLNPASMTRLEPVTRSDRKHHPVPMGE